VQYHARNVLPALALFVALGARAETPTAHEILDAMDETMTFDARTARIEMTVEGRRARSFEIVGHTRGEEESAFEFVSPPREEGTRMLLRGDDLWIYLPQVDRTQRVSGAMLREGMMGSDISYEDLMATRELRERYEAELVGEDTVGERPCWRLELTATDEAVAYPRRRVCVDKDTSVPLEQELYALSGMLLKTWTMSGMRDFGEGRVYPSRMVVQDHLTPDTTTRVEFKDIEFEVEHPDELFTLDWLEEGAATGAGGGGGGGASNTDLYYNDPLAFLPNLAGGALHRVRSQVHLTMVVGRAPNEGECVSDTAALGSWLKQKGVPSDVAFWGRDSKHDYTWWRRQAQHYLGQLF
jgi:outer membrane lipoprotein-sorting protein